MTSHMTHLITDWALSGDLPTSRIGGEKPEVRRIGNNSKSKSCFPIMMRRDFFPLCSDKYTLKMSF